MSGLIVDLACWWIISGMARRRGLSQSYCWWALLGIIGLCIVAAHINRKPKVQP